MEMMTRDELKQQIQDMEAAENKNTEPSTELEAEHPEPEQPEGDVSTGETETLQEIPGTPKEEEEEIEPWLKGDSDGQTVPLKVLRSTRDKLKGKIQSKDSEIERLKAEIEQIKANTQTAKVGKVAAVTERPILDDFDDVKAYNAAMDAYEASKFAAYEASLNQKREIDRQRQLEQKKVDDHYNRASELTSKYGVSEDDYLNADSAVRHAVDAIAPGMGDVITDNIIARLGEGSEKLMFALGKNKTMLAEFQSTLLTDRTGLSAMVYLAEKKSELLNKTIKTKSNARPPASTLSGDSGGNGSTKNLKSQYEKAVKEGDFSAAHMALKKGRAAKMDVDSW